MARGINHCNGRSDIISALAIATDIVHLAREAAAVQPIQGVLSAVLGILSIIKDTIKNKEDFRDLIEQCEWVGRLIVNNPFEGQGQMIPALSEAFNTLESTLIAMRDRLTEMGRRNFYKRMLTSTLDVQRIEDMTLQLDRHLSNLKTALHLVNMHFLQRQTDSDYASAPPPRPAIFLGRDDIVGFISDILLSGPGSNRCHVALLGVGGIGKSSIAKAVLNTPQIEGHFAKRRFFVRFDDIHSSQITYAAFIDRISRALGIPAGNDHSLILQDIKSQITLLVLDNGETFLDPEASRDVSRIKMAIDEIGGFPTVSILLTSRSRGLPHGLVWKKVEVPRLDPASAFDVFMNIFQGDVLQSRTTLKNILAAADHHPLTITLLAYAAETNSWSIDDLNNHWAARRTKVLNLGHGKYENLAVSIEMSLNTPCVAIFGGDVQRVFGMIAFFPQGIPRKNLRAMFPSVGRIFEIVEVLHKQSLITFIDGFATMLAPIRLHTKDALPVPDASLLDDIRDHYHKLIRASIITEKALIIEGDESVKSLILSEDINIETLIIFDLNPLSIDMDMIRALHACEAFILCLLFHRPRSTSLWNVLQSLDATASPAVYSAQFRCFKALAALAQIQYNLRDSVELFTIARNIAMAIGQYDDAIQATLFLAGFYLNIGAYRAAKQTLERACEIPGWRTTTILNQALACGILGHLEELTNIQTTARGFVDIYQLYQGAGSLAHAEVRRALAVLALPLIHGGHRDQCAHGRLRKLIMNLGYETKCGAQSHVFIMFLANAAFIDQDIAGTRRYLQRAWLLSVENKFFSRAARLLIWLAILALVEGKASEARDLLNQANEQERVHCVFSELNRWYSLYVSGVLELVSGNLPDALRIFGETKGYCESRGEFHVRALSSRAMGEVAHLQGNFVQSRMLFRETAAICTDAGIVPHLLHRSYVVPVLGRVPPATYCGWTAFLRDTSEIQ